MTVSPSSPIPGAKDEVYRENLSAVGDFTFGEKVASVFDDMLGRSVPFYEEMQRMVAEMAADFATPGSNIYDLGCSTGTTILNIAPGVPADIKFIGIDNSREMLKRCAAKMEEQKFARDYELRLGDLNEKVQVENASMVMLVLTLQFVRPLHRDRLVAEIYAGMNENGCLILIEKFLGEDSVFNRLFIKYYYDMKKKNGYSETEIAQKREALENVLIPYKPLENREMLLRAGFRYTDQFFKWYNFGGIVAIK